MHQAFSLSGLIDYQYLTLLPRSWLQKHATQLQHQIHYGQVCQRSRHCKRFRMERRALEEADWEEEMSLFRKRLQVHRLVTLHWRSLFSCCLIQTHLLKRMVTS